ncbi:MAG: TIGR03905 family TSCPD domain-containing protein [Oscillospiraceae bacterium]|jgi:uncharacterized protein (TIGR03905 family)|nr:TIGR03905 family TSCPD domain-containing protein [Oscillospiraceae bacterium]
MYYEFRTHGVCARTIKLELEDGIIRSVEFDGGCAGNALGISKLVEGMDARLVADKFRGTRCGKRPTSCPDQLAQALDYALRNP